MTTERSSRLSEGLYSRELEGRLVWSRPSGCCRVTLQNGIMKQKLVNPRINVWEAIVIIALYWGEYWVPIESFGFGTGIRTRAWHLTFMMTHFCVTLLDLSTTSEPNLWQIEIWKCFRKIYFLFHSILFLIIPEDVPCVDLCHFTFCSSFTEPDMRKKD